MNMVKARLGLTTFVIALSLWSTASAKPLPTAFVHRVLDCGSFKVEANTLLSRPNDDFEVQGFSQTIRLFDVKTHHSVELPIFRRFSRSTKFRGRLVLDGLVWGWECMTAKTGKNYVMLLWSCTNPESKTCEAAMDINGEWMTIYDVNGRLVPANPRDMKRSDEHRIRALGL